ncbi:hypothetical protein CI109_107203 [Kwoniella shandongensis]|uniref:Uncharacterized protein n=1 Tax=Kwoniella shandongensis TaxID=1734106 RepID=A0A5M6C6P4_9TREE|nr:uncharacterized protein CI109_002486 [Kwoniella shandongensis]KAA5529145.1 hypothetical protein CI109_002486 [Kwoniella shandongensis]
MQFQTLFTLLPALAALPAINAYFILSHPILETTRLDPIVNPGEIGGHVHSIVGGNNFDKEMTYESALESTCTTAPITVDKSNYWTPQMYYYNPKDASYQAIPVSYVNTYYLPRYSPGETTVRAFPDGLRMLSGDPNRRTYNGDAESNAVTYVCLDYSGSHSGDPAWAERNSFFEHNCPQGMRAQVNFPSCWDGVNLDSDDHQSHMAWPSGGVDGGSCPKTHPVRLVSLFYEFIYNVQNFPFNDLSEPTWVFANGDTTGYGMHGDFLNGWPSYKNGTNVLQQALDQCNQDNGVGGVLSACPPFVPYIDSGAASACRPLNDQVNEDVGFGHPISSLPGDNVIWIGNSTIKPTKPDYNDSSIGYTDFKSVIPAGFTEVGCIAEAANGRALSGATFSSKNMTRGACVSWCADRGYPLAGVEYGQECYCDFAMRNGASNTTLLDSSKCKMTCANNTNENCGGSATLNLFNNPSLYPVAKIPAGWSSNGCMTEATNARALSGYSFASGSMTQDLCMQTCRSKGFNFAGIEYASECYCGNSFNTGSVAATDGCTMACSGNKLQTCGGGNRLTTFKWSNGTAAVSASASASASASSSASSSAAASSSAKASSTSSAASSSSSAAASSASVVAKVAAASSASSSSSSASASSVSSAAASSSSSKVVVASSASASASASTSTVAPAVAVSTTAASSSTSVASSTSTAAASSSTSKAASSSAAASSSSSVAASSTSSSAAAASSSAAPALAQQYIGCYTEASGGRHLNGSYYANTQTMTNEVCMNYCKSKGFAYAGTEYAQECFCGNYLNQSLLTADAKCSTPCRGNNAQKCGGGNLLSIYGTGLTNGVKYNSTSSSTGKRSFSAKFRLE